jgi:MFS transporter, DHA1 family, inner membrane transport protein
VALAITASFLFSGIGFGSAVAAQIYPVYGYRGVLLSSLFFFGLAAACLKFSHSYVTSSALVDLPAQDL